MHPMTRRVLFTGFVLVILCARSVAAQTSFYEGKTITMLRGGAPGGPGGVTVRMLEGTAVSASQGSDTFVNVENVIGSDGVRSFVNARAVTVYLPGFNPSIVNCESRASFCLTV